MNPIVIQHKDYSSTLKLTYEQLKELNIDPTAEEIRGEMTTVGMWNIPKSYKALCVSGKFAKFPVHKTETTIYGWRTMFTLRQTGYTLDGWVSIKGKKYSCFTSDELIETPDGHLISVATIFARERKVK